jgi:Zn-dependent peptidase ImmA (M78 family)/DNA-binding XRE family transcriptional regulator
MGDMKKINYILINGRKKAGLTQAELGQRLGCSRDTIIRLENGKQNITLDQVVGYIRHCKIDPQEIVRAFEPEPAGDFAFMLRMHDLHHITPEIKGQFKTWYLNCEKQNRTESPLIFREIPNFPQDVKRDPRTQGEESADQTRQLWGLGTTPIDDPVRIVENLGIHIQGADLGQNDLYALSGKKADSSQFGMIININPAITIERQRFSIIHELAHIIAHRDEFCIDCSETGKGRTKDPKEIYADAFAGAFLVPKAEIERFIRVARDKGITETGALILQLKRYFGVSYQTILLRLRSMGYFSNERQFGIIFGKLKKTFGTKEPQAITTPLEFRNQIPLEADMIFKMAE